MFNIVDVSQQLNKNGEFIQRNSKDINSISIHYNPNNDPHSLANDDISKGLNGIRYHYLVDEHGRIYKTNKDEDLTPHTDGYNDVSLGICIGGNLDNGQMTPSQKESLNNLTRYLKEKYPSMNNIKCNHEYPNNAGQKVLDGNSIRDDYNKFINKEGPYTDKVSVRDKNYNIIKDKTQEPVSSDTREPIGRPLREAAGVGGKNGGSRSFSGIPGDLEFNRARKTTTEEIINRKSQQSSIYSHEMGMSTIRQDHENRRIEEIEKHRLTDEINNNSQLAQDQALYGNPTAEVNSLKGIFGIPKQFNSTTDMRLGGDYKDIGREYGDRIMTRMPLLFLAPGRPLFLKGYSEQERETIAQMIAGGAENLAAKVSELGGTGVIRYYSFQYDYPAFWKYANASLIAEAALLGLSNKINPLTGVRYGDGEWERAKNSWVGSITRSSFLCYYVDAETSTSDSFSNDTTDSLLEGYLDTLTDKARELNMLFGNDDEKIGAAKTANDLFNKVAGVFGSDKNNPSGSILQNSVYIASGGRLIFPKIYKSSRWDKRYNIKVKLTATSGDTETVFREVIAPALIFAHLVLPKSKGPNVYLSPFLVKGFMKGFMSVEMGILDGMEWERGGEGAWNIDGLPTEMTISATLSDMYDVMAMSNINEIFNSKIYNIQLLDFLATMAGVPLIKPDVEKMRDLYSVISTNKYGPGHNLHRAYLDLEAGISNAASTLINKFLFGGR